MFSEAELNQLFRYGCSLTHHEADAYDLLHNALEKYLHAQHNNNIKDSHAYVRQIMRHQFIDQTRQKTRFPQESYNQKDEDDEQAHNIVALDCSPLEDVVIASKTLEYYWQQLSTEEREILFLWAVEDYTAQEMSELMSIPRNTILSKVHRLKKKLQRLNQETEAHSNIGDST